MSSENSAAVAAQIANRLLEPLWAEVVDEHEGAARFLREMSSRLVDFNAITGIRDFHRTRRADYGPVWREESLMIAEAIRKGQREVLVEVGDDADSPTRYLDRIHGLRRAYSATAAATRSRRGFGRSGRHDNIHAATKHGKSVHRIRRGP